MAPGKYVRIEMLFDGEPQECGLFQALDATGITEEQYFGYMDYFEKELISPTVDATCWFFFTKEGLEKFLPKLLEILELISPHGWGFSLLLMETSCLPVYKDELQAAWEYDSKTPMPVTVRNVLESGDMKKIIRTFMAE